eukprot:gene5452-6134_t
MNGTLRPNNSGAYIDCLDSEYYNPICDEHNGSPFQLTPGKALSAFGIVILIIAAIAGNVLVCSAFCYYRRLRTVTNYFIVSLAVSDIMVAAISMPLWLSYELTGWVTLPTWVNFYTLLHVWEICDILAGVSSVANLTAVSLDRFFSIIAPLHHRARMTSFVGIMMISFCWIYSLTVSLCRLTNIAHYVLVIAVLGYFLPLSLVLFCYIAIYVKFRMRSSRQGAGLEGDWNIEKTLLIVIGLFVLCWMPFHILSLVYMYCISCKFSFLTLTHVTSFTKWMHYLNSCCNPIIYGFFNINFKTAFWAMFHKCIGSRYSDMDMAGLSRDSSQNGTFLRHLKTLRRKLSMKRDVEESIVSNGELNDNSLSMAMLALHLSTPSNDVGYQEASSLLIGDSTSRSSSSKVSDEQALLRQSSDANERANACNSMNDLSKLVSHSLIAENDDDDAVFDEPTTTATSTTTTTTGVVDNGEDFDKTNICSENKFKIRGTAMPNGMDVDNQSSKILHIEGSHCTSDELMKKVDSQSSSHNKHVFLPKFHMINETEIKGYKHLDRYIKDEQFLDSKESVV